MPLRLLPSNPVHYQRAGDWHPWSFKMKFFKIFMHPPGDNELSTFDVARVHHSMEYLYDKYIWWVKLWLLKSSTSLKRIFGETLCHLNWVMECILSLLVWIIDFCFFVAKLLPKPQLIYQYLEVIERIFNGYSFSFKCLYSLKPFKGGWLCSVY